MKSILIVDDETPIREWIAACIQDYVGIKQILTARNGEEAIKLLCSTDIDIVFTDITMPKLDGIQLLAYVKREFPDINVVIMSVHNEFDYARSALKLGAYDYILKNEISKEGIFLILDQISSQQEISSTDINHGLISIDQIIRSKYLQSILANQAIQMDYEVLRRNKIFIEDRLLFAIAMPDSPEKLVQNRLNNSECLSNVTFFTYGKSKMLMMANIEQEDIGFVQDLAETIGRIIEGNVGFSQIFPGFEGFLNAAKQAIALCEIRFYGPVRMDDLVKANNNADKIVKNELDSIQNQIVENFKLHRCDSAITLFNDMIDRIEILKLADVDYVKRCISSTVQRLFNQSKSIDIDVKLIENRILSSKDVNEVRSILEVFFSEMENCGRLSSSIAQSIEYISKNFMYQISLGDIAKAVYLNDEYFSRLFKKEIGVNFTDYLLNLRMETARKLLITTDEKIYTIAERVGVLDHKYFSLLFRKTFNMTPSQMRDKHKSQ